MKLLYQNRTVYLCIFIIAIINVNKLYVNVADAVPTGQSGVNDSHVASNAKAGSLPNMWCLSWHCSSSMYRCMTDADCRKGLFCMQACGTNQTCTFHCIYSYMNDYFEEFMDCAVTKNKCVELKAEYPPYKCKRPTNLKGKFNLLWKSMDGEWQMGKGFNNFHDCLPTCTTVNIDVSRNRVKHSFYIKTLEGEDKLVTNWKEVQLKKDGSAQMNYNLAGLELSEDWFIIESSKNSYLLYYCGYFGAWEYDGNMLLLSANNETLVEEVKLKRDISQLCDVQFPQDLCQITTHYEL